VKNVPLPASPDGDGKVPDKLPAGTKTAPFVSPNGGNPHRGSGIGAPLPSLNVVRWEALQMNVEVKFHVEDAQGGEQSEMEQAPSGGRRPHPPATVDRGK
jgi:hypothetical protein